MPAYIADYSDVAKQADVISINPSDTYFNSNLKNITVPANKISVVGKKVDGTKFITSKKLEALQNKRIAESKVIIPEETPLQVGGINLTRNSSKLKKSVHNNTTALEIQNEIQNIINKKFGKPLEKDYKLLEKITGLKSNVTKFDNQPKKIQDLLKSMSPEDYAYPDGDILNKSKLINRGEYSELTRQPYNNVFYNPSSPDHFNWKQLNNYKYGGTFKINQSKTK